MSYLVKSSQSSGEVKNYVITASAVFVAVRYIVRTVCSHIRMAATERALFIWWRYAFKRSFNLSNR